MAQDRMAYSTHAKTSLPPELWLQLPAMAEQAGPQTSLADAPDLANEAKKMPSHGSKPRVSQPERGRVWERDWESGRSTQ